MTPLDVDRTIDGKFSWKVVFKQTVAILDFWWFMIVTSVVYYSLFPISMIFVGRFGTVHLDAVGLGNTIFNVVGILVLGGLQTGCDTTMAQSYGTKNKKMVGVYFQRSLYVYSLATMVSIAILLNTETFLVLIGQDRQIARLAGDYVTILSSGLLGYGLWGSLVRFFRANAVIWISLVSTACTLLISVLGHYLFINVWDFGIEGSAYAQVIAYWSGLAITLILTPFQKRVLRRTWGGFTSESLQNWGTFSILSFAGLFLICLQWWGLEICTILSGKLGKVELAAQSILFQVNYYMYMSPICVGVSCNILIAQYIGANSPQMAKLTMKIGWIASWSLCTVSILVLLLLRHEIPKVFSTDQDVIALTSDTIPYLALYHVFDSTVSSSLGICRGVARQKMGSCVSFFGIYVIGLPTAMFLTFYEQIGLRGLWLGPSAGLAVESVLILVLLTRTDWEAE